MMRKIRFLLLAALVSASAYAQGVGAQSNTVYGQSACNALTTEGGNSCFGYETGASTTSGSANSFFGRAAGLRNEEGSHNSFFGSGAGVANTSGEFNTFLGAASGIYNITGSRNTLVGHYSGIDLGTGSYNSALGTLTTFRWPFLSYATVIGAGAQALASNSITLGRRYGEDTVKIPGMLELRMLSISGITPVCRNVFNTLAECSSSMRYKTNINSFPSGVALLRRLKPVSFNWREGGMPDIGLVAEDVFKVEPLLTTLNDKGQVEGVKYDRLSVVLINAIKEQQAEIDALRKYVCSRHPKTELCWPRS